jgi:Ca2+-binding RTX toxin-like protein
MRQGIGGKGLAAILTAGAMMGALAPAATAASFPAPTPLTIPDNAQASIYPSGANVVGVPGNTVKVTATLTGLSHTFPRDMDVLLVGPTGAKSLLLSDVCGQPGNFANATLTFDDAGQTIAADNVPCPAGTYKPTDFNLPPGTDVLPAPAPAGPYTASMAVFNGSSPNGLWNLFVRDDAGGASGSLAGGWKLDVLTDVKCAGQNGTSPTSQGTEGADVLTGTPGDDVMLGLGGNDTINGLGGSDIVCGGAGNDILRGGPGKDRLLGEGGKDKLKGNGGKDVCKGGPGRDTAGACEKVKAL